MEKCGNLTDAVKQSLVLAIEVAEKTILDSPRLIQQVLDDPAVQNAIRKAALDEARQMAAAQRSGKTVTEKDAKSLLEAVGNAAGDAALSSVKKQIEQTAAFRSLKKEVKDLQCAFQQSPLGVFVDRNKGWLIVVGAGMGIAGVTAMYVFRSGDFFAAKAGDFAGKVLRFKVLGNVEMGASSIKFVPGNRQVAATLFAEVKWKPVTVRFETSVDFREGDLKSATAKATTNINIAKGLVLAADGAGGYSSDKSRFTYHLGLGLTWKQMYGQKQLSLNARAFVEQTPDAQKSGGSLTAKIDLFRLPDRSSLSLGLSGEFNQLRPLDPLPNPGTRSGTEARGMLILEWKHDLLGK